MPKDVACIPLDQCEHRRLYELHSRNLRRGVFVASHRGFYGIRTKFGRRLVALELHYEAEAPFGTARPLRALDAVVPPEVDLVETVLMRPGADGFDPAVADGRLYHETRIPLLSWLEEHNG